MSCLPSGRQEGENRGPKRKGPVMKVTLIRKGDFKVTPWKNGQGTTAEIDMDPAGSDFTQGKFNWRLSSARIESENEFSVFPGYDRLLTVLSGEGLLLNNEELGPFETVEFQGEDPVQCVLLGNPVEDLGVIFKRGFFSASMQLIHVKARMDLKLTQGTHFFLAIGATLEVGGVELESPNFLKVEEATSIEINSSNFPSLALKISIEQKSEQVSNFH